MIIPSSFQKAENEGTFSPSFYQASNNLILKPEMRTKGKKIQINISNQVTCKILNMLINPIAKYLKIHK